MIELSSKTIVGRKLPLRELMKTIKADKATKEDAKKVESVVLTNVLSKDTLNAKNAGNVKEVFLCCGMRGRACYAPRSKRKETRG